LTATQLAKLAENLKKAREAGGNAGEQQQRRHGAAICHGAFGRICGELYRDHFGRAIDRGGDDLGPRSALIGQIAVRFCDGFSRKWTDQFDAQAAHSGSAAS